MNREQVRTAIWLALITSVISLLSAYAQTDPNSADGGLIQSRLMASLWLESLPLAAILVLILASPWYLVKLFKRLRSKQPVGIWRPWRPSNWAVQHRCKTP